MAGLKWPCIYLQVIMQLLGNAPFSLISYLFFWHYASFLSLPIFRNLCRKIRYKPSGSGPYGAMGQEFDGIRTSGHEREFPKDQYVRACPPK